MFFKQQGLSLKFLLMIVIAVLSGCATQGGGVSKVPVEERSSDAIYGRVPKHTPPPQPVFDPSSNQVVLVSPLTVPGRKQWQPIKDSEVVTSVPRQYSQAAPGDLNPAVVALLTRANTAERKGDLLQSEANIERSIRIQPDSAWLWHRLALIRLFQRKDQEALSTAAKSNSLAQGNFRLQRDNWKIIAQANEHLGNTKAAEKAAIKVKALTGK